MYHLVRLEWDAKENRSNQKKHGGVANSAGMLLAGFAGLCCWWCMYTSENPNGEEQIRIISAREADPQERRIYLEQAAD